MTICFQFAAAGDLKSNTGESSEVMLWWEAARETLSRDDSYMDQKVTSVISVRPVCRHCYELGWWRCNKRTKLRRCFICSVRKKVLDMICGREVDEEKGSALCWAISDLHGEAIPGGNRRALFRHGEFEQILWNYDLGWFIELNKLRQAITEEAALLWVTYTRLLPNCVGTCMEKWKWNMENWKTKGEEKGSFTRNQWIWVDNCIWLSRKKFSLFSSFSAHGKLTCQSVWIYNNWKSDLQYWNRAAYIEWEERPNK